MRLVLVSDTHTTHARVRVPRCDLLVHAGDYSRRGTLAELEAFVAWLGAQPAEAKVFVSGNWDRAAEREPERVRALAAAHGVHYLEDEGVSVLGLSVWGSPVAPTIGRTAFHRPRGEAIRAHWSRIPEGVDLLVTHGPPRGIGDRTFLGTNVGCDDLARRVREVEPRLHVFGHIHEAHGEHRLPGVRTRFVNAASARILRGPREPLVITL